MKTIIPIFISLLMYNVSSAQLFITSGSKVNVDPNTLLYCDIELINEGTVSFDSTGDLYLDAGLDNETGTLTLNDAILHLGSNQTRAGGNHDLIFNTNDDNVKFVEFGKNSGTYTVDENTGGLLNITKTFTSNSGTFEANDKIILKSTSISNTTIVPESQGGTVNNIRVERFIPGNRAFRFLASPVTTGGSIKPNIEDNWQQDIHITGGPSSGGFDQNSTGNPSMYTFDNSSQSYNPIPNTNATPLTVGDAYYTLVRGDRDDVNININDNSNQTDATLKTTGTLAIGNQTPVNAVTPGGAGEGWILVANPYQAPVDMSGILSGVSNIDNTQIWVWDPKANAVPNKGQFAVVTLSNGNNNLTGSNANNILQPGQSVFIRSDTPANPGSATVNFDETDKVVGLGNLVDIFNNGSNQTSDGWLRLGIYPSNSTPFTDVAKDGIILQFDDNYDNNISQDDSSKLFAHGENLAMLINNEYISINSRKQPVDYSETIELFTQNLTDNQYTFSIELQGMNDLPEGVILWDKYEDTYTTLSDQQTITFDVDQSIPNTSATDRFALVFEKETFGTENQELNNISLYPNPVIEDDLTIRFSELNANETDIVIYNQVGQKVYNQTFTDHNSTLQIENLDTLAAGAYILNVEQDNQAKSFTIIKK
jgi:hypothetical protein